MGIAESKSRTDRRIAHLDMDAFFASVELLRYPDLVGAAVVVGGRHAPMPEENPDGQRHYARLRHYVGRGVVTTSTYPARALGVHSGMGLMKSARLAPDAVLLPADFDSYRRYSRRFKAAVAAVTPCIEDRGIDEIYIDLSDHPDDSHTLALRLSDAVFDATGLHCSIGIAPNKLLAKLCSDLDKPRGITILNADELARRIWPLPAKRINGIGPKMNERLAQLGIETIGQLAAVPPETLIRHFGPTTGSWMHRAAWGVDEQPLVLASAPKSLSRERTFERDLHARRDRNELGEIFTDLCQRLAGDLARKGYACRTVGIKLRYANFRAVTREQTLASPIGDSAALRLAAGLCLKRVPLELPLRLLGVRAGNLLPHADAGQRTMPLIQGELTL